METAATPRRILNDLARHNHGVVATRTVTEHGVAQSTFFHVVHADGWEHRARGVWLHPAWRDSTWTQAALALAGASGVAAVTGRAALHLHGVRCRFPREMRLLLPRGSSPPRRSRGPRIRTVSSRRTDHRDIVVRRGLRLASVERCFVDEVAPPGADVRTIRDLLITTVQARHATPASVRAVAERCVGARGRATLRRAPADIDGVGSDSPFSDRVHRQLLASGFRPDPHPVPVHTRDRVLHPDITFSGRHVCIECDSLLAHGRQRDLFIDAKKDRGYWGVGWLNLRIGWHEFEHAFDGFLADLDLALRLHDDRGDGADASR